MSEKPADAGTRLEDGAGASLLEAGTPEPAVVDAGTRERPDAGAPAPARPKCRGWPVIEAEPNDAPAQATAMGDASCGAIDAAGDVDHLVIDSARQLVFDFFAHDDDPGDDGWGGGQGCTSGIACVNGSCTCTSGPAKGQACDGATATGPEFVQRGLPILRVMLDPASAIRRHACSAGA